MPVDLPGYYFDTSKNRYFKITANHVAEGSSSTSAVKYSRQAVQAKQATEKLNRRAKSLKASRDAVTVRRSKLLQHPLLHFESRLGSRKKNAGSTVKEFYVASLDKELAIQYPNIDGLQDRLRNVSGQFVVDEESGHMLTYGGLQNGNRAACLLEPAENSHVLYRRGKVIQEIGYVTTVDRIISLGRHGVSVWACQAASFNNQAGIRSTLYVSRHSVPEPENSIGSGVTVEYQRPTPIIDLAVAPSHDAFATVDSRRVSVNYPEMNTVKEVFRGKLSSSFTSAWFKDNNVILCGARDGAVRIADLRSTVKANSSVPRIQHQSGISHVRTVGVHQVLVHGLTSTSLYDLRWCPQPSRSSSRDDRPPNQPTFNTSPAYLSFNIPGQRRQNRYGLGFAYDAELNIVLGASTDFHTSHCVNLWDASTGRLLQSPLLNHQFDAPVTCAQFVDVRPQATSILLAAKEDIQEWSPLHSHEADGWR